MRYRIGRKAHVLAKEKGLLEKIHGDSMLSSVNNALIISNMLFKAQYEAESQISDLLFISAAIDQAPRVKAILDVHSNDCQDYEKVVVKLRELLDPYEWDSAMWPWKILAAEQWFELEAEIARGVRGNSIKTTRRIALAKQMFKEGTNKTGIAKKLGVNPSAISKWLKRKSNLVLTT